MAAALRALKDLVKAYQDPTPLPFGDRYAAVRSGFKPDTWEMYGLEPGEHVRYVPNDLWGPLHRLNGRYPAFVLGNKLLFWREFSDRLPLPSVLACVAKGHVVPVSDGRLTTFDALLERSREAPMVIKPMAGEKGKRVMLLDWSRGELRLNQRPVDVASAVSELAAADGSVVVEFVEQAAYASAIFPGSTNSLRVLTFGGPGAEGGAFVAATAHKFGHDGGGAVDNFAAGGLLASVDPRTGTIGRGIRRPEPGAPTEWVERHPSTGIQFAGVVVPGLPAVLDSLLAFMRAHPYLVYVGWDVVITDDARGFKVLEANHHAAIQVQQAGFPYLEDPRVVRFLAHHGLLSKLRPDARRRALATIEGGADRGQGAVD